MIGGVEWSIIGRPTLTRVKMAKSSGAQRQWQRAWPREIPAWREDL